MICGDFNSPIRDNTDYIEGVDDLPERNMHDFECNPYCDKFLDFLINANCCVLNGRAGVYAQDNYTCVSSKGKSVMDYCIVPYESLHLFSQFKVHLALDMFNEACSLGNIDPVHSIPDHSLLTWVMDGCETFTSINNGDHNGDNFSVLFTKFDTSDIPYNFMLSEESITAIDQALEKLEQSQFTQVNIDDIFGNFCDTVKM